MLRIFSFQLVDGANIAIRIVVCIVCCIDICNGSVGIAIRADCHSKVEVADSKGHLELCNIVMISQGIDDTRLICIACARSGVPESNLIVIIGFQGRIRSSYLRIGPLTCQAIGFNLYCSLILVFFTGARFARNHPRDIQTVRSFFAKACFVKAYIGAAGLSAAKYKLYIPNVL